MKYMMIYEQGNGYFCGCCRRTYQDHETMEFENDEACLEYVKTYNGDNTRETDCVVEEVHQMFGEGNQIYP